MITWFANEIFTMNIQINIHVNIYNEYLWWNRDIYFIKKNVQNVIYVLKNVLLSIQQQFKYNKYLLTLIEYLFEYLWEHYESIEHSNKYSKICTNIQKKNWIFIWIFNFLNIHFVKKNSKMSWIFMIFMNIHDIQEGTIPRCL